MTTPPPSPPHPELGRDQQQDCPQRVRAPDKDGMGKGGQAQLGVGVTAGKPGFQEGAWSFPCLPVGPDMRLS